MGSWGTLAWLVLACVMAPTRLWAPRHAAPWAARVRADAKRARIARLPLPPETPRDRAYVVERANGTDHVVWGTLRFDVHGQRITAARDRPYAPIVSATRVAIGWVFVTAEGAVLASADFTGPLRVVGTVACLRRVVYRSYGIAVIEDANGFWATDGGSLTRLADTRGALAVAFADGDHGALVRPGGALQTTRDGGQTWQPVDLGGEAAWALAGTWEGLFVQTTDGAWRSLRDGALVEGAPVVTPPPQSQNYPLAPDMQALATTRLDVVGAAAACPRTEPAAPERWHPPGFVVDLPRSPRDQQLRFGPRYAARLGSDTALVAVESREASGPVAVTYGALDPAGHRSVTLRWRGMDESGPFTGRHDEADDQGFPNASTEEPVKLVVTTRRGIVVSPSWVEPPAPGPVWFGEAGRRSLPVGGSAFLHAFALPDGGFVLWATASFDPDAGARRRMALPTEWGLPRTFADILLVCGPDGVPRLRRAWAWRDEDVAFAGVGRLGDRWGLVRTRPDAPGQVVLLPLDGGALLDVDTLPGTLPTACPPEPGDFEIHVLNDPDARYGAGPDVRIGTGFDSPDYVTARHIVYERHASALCVRRIDGVHEEFADADGHTFFAGAHFVAAGRGLAGTEDDGRHITRLTGTIVGEPALPADE